MDYTLRLATPADEAFLEQLFKDVNRADFLPLGLPPEQLEQLLASQARAQYTGYATQFPAGENFIVMVGPYPIGRIYLAELANELLIVDMALLSAFRGQGIGTRLLRDVQRRALEAGLPVTLRVEPYKPAARLYVRLGFEVTGVDPINLLMRWGAGPTTASTPPADREDDGPVSPDHSSRFFRTLLGKTLAAVAPTGGTLELTLREVGVESSQDTQAIQGDSFSLRFDVASTDVPWQQGMFEVAVGSSTSLSLFMTPVRFGDGGVGYQAVYNRNRPRA